MNHQTIKYFLERYLSHAIKSATTLIILVPNKNHLTQCRILPIASSYFVCLFTFSKSIANYLVDFLVMMYLAVATKNVEQPPQLYGMKKAA